MPFDNPQHVPFEDIDYLREAREYIRTPRTWSQKKYHDGVQHCAVGALDLATHSNKVQIRRLCKILSRELSLEARMLLFCVPARAKIIMFNDSAHTKHERVIELFDHAILHLEQNAMVCV